MRAAKPLRAVCIRMLRLIALADRCSVLSAARRALAIALATYRVRSIRALARVLHLTRRGVFAFVVASEYERAVRRLARPCLN